MSLSSSRDLTPLIDQIASGIKELRLASSQSSSSRVDKAWWPTVPLGHTVYSWGEDLEADVQPSSSSSSPASSSSSPSTSSSSTSSSSSSTSSSTTAPPATTTTTTDAPKSGNDKEKKKGGKPAASSSSSSSGPSASEFPNVVTERDLARLDIRVGHIIKATKLEGSEKLYVEEIDVGEDKPRQILSGLAQHIPLSEVENSLCFVICNLKPASLAGSISYGMVLCASSADHSVVEFIRPAAGSRPGERISIEDVDVSGVTAEAEVDGKKKKGNTWLAIAPFLKTNEQREATYYGKRILTSKGPAHAKSLTNVQIA